MLNVRLYDDFQKMMENEGRAEEVLERFFNDMVEEQNFDLSFYQWCRKNLYYNTIGDFYICADEALREQIKGAGIGTSATRGGIIQKLERINYIEINPKTTVITPSQFGEAVYDVVSASMKDMLNPKLTASWEKGLDMVAKKEIKADEFMVKLENYINRNVNKFIYR